MFVLTLLVSLLLSTSSGAKNSERREERIYNKANRVWGRLDGRRTRSVDVNTPDVLPVADSD
jgi:hypothetical protein